MNQGFNITLAQKYGIEEAILIEIIYWWVHKNECDEVEEMVHEGRIWCRSSAKGFAKYIPYMSPSKINRILRGLELEEVGVLKSGNFNTKATNQTLWYTFTETFKKELVEFGYDFTKMEIGICKNVKCNNSIINNTLNDNNILDKEKKVKDKPFTKKSSRFVKPTIEQIDAYIKKNNYHFDAEHFFNYYESKGWVIGKNSPMKDWQAACRTWEAKRKQEEKKEGQEESPELPPGMTPEKWKEITLYFCSILKKVRVSPKDFVLMKEKVKGNSVLMRDILLEIDSICDNYGISDLMSEFDRLLATDGYASRL